MSTGEAMRPTTVTAPERTASVGTASERMTGEGTASEWPGAGGPAQQRRHRPTTEATADVVLTVLMLALFGWAMATLFGLVTVRFRDTHYLGELGFQALFYLTPVIYEPEILIQRGLGFLMQANPLVPFLTLLRQPILHSRAPDLSTYAAATLVTLVAAGAAGLLLWHEERRLIFHL